MVALHGTRHLPPTHPFAPQVVRPCKSSTFCGSAGASEAGSRRADPFAPGSRTVLCGAVSQVRTTLSIDHRGRKNAEKTSRPTLAVVCRLPGFTRDAALQARLSMAWSRHRGDAD